MFNFKRIGAGLTLGAALTLFAQSALALGLGNLIVESYLNQPLQARIELVVRADDDLSTATVGMASADDYALIGANRGAISVPLRFDLEEDESGASILVTSEESVRDPVIRLIVEVNWSNGRLLREYTLFLDPPTHSAPAPSPVVDERGKTPVSPPPETAEWVSSDRSGQPESSATPTVGSNEYGPVRSGDTLWRIATDWSQGTDLDMNSVMLAIQRNNPQAFINGNVNLLKQGTILRMPRVDEVRQISAESALQEVAQQNSVFSQELAAPAMETPLLDANSQQLPAAEASTGSAEPGDQLELVPPAEHERASTAGASGVSTADSQDSAPAEELREELARKEEELIVEQQQNQYLQEQITELKTQLRMAQEGNVADAGLSQVEAQIKKERLSGDKATGGQVQQTGSAPAEQSERAAVPEVKTIAPEETGKHWYSSLTFWVLVLLVLGAGVAGWFINRRNSGQALDLELPEQTDETVREMKDEAEEILQVLKEDETPEAAKPSDGANVEDAGKEAPEPEITTRRARPSEEAELLDEDSADPEVRLDLARAYISMGDREAARVILDEVVEHGSEEQQAEARKMLDGF
jgi:pilus assembly protein FimV